MGIRTSYIRVLRGITRTRLKCLNRTLNVWLQFWWCYQIMKLFPTSQFTVVPVTDLLQLHGYWPTLPWIISACQMIRRLGFTSYKCALGITGDKIFKPTGSNVPVSSAVSSCILLYLFENQKYFRMLFEQTITVTTPFGRSPGICASKKKVAPPSLL